MKKKIFIALNVLFIFIIVKSQGIHSIEDSIINKENNKSLYRSISPFISKEPGVPEPPDPGYPEFEVVHTPVLKGELKVSHSGSANYEIPIMAMLGVRDVVPKISISYNSLSGNGLVGYGWDIKGISSIKRIGSTIYHNGGIKGIKLNNEDHFSLDGQRLILVSGIHGKKGATYNTENYSNVKIIIQEVDTVGEVASFLINYPDGSYATYDAKSKLEWCISLWSDAQDNIISYTYLNDNGLLTLESIMYRPFREGVSRGFPPAIKFKYKDRQRKEQVYINGAGFYRTKILDEIEVQENRVAIYRYKFNYSVTSLNYERLESIVKCNYPLNGNYCMDPIKFTYNDSPIESIKKIGDYKFNTELAYNPSSDKNQPKIATGYFDSDRKMDFIIKDPDNKTNIFYLFTKIDSKYSHAETLDLSKENTLIGDIFSTTILNSDGGIQTKTNAITIMKKYPGNSWSDKTIISNYIKKDNGIVLEYEKYFTPRNAVFSFVNNLAGDFDGDGLSDIIKVYTVQGTNEGVVVFYDNKKDSNNNEYVSKINNQLSLASDRIFSLDFDGDGKTDIAHVSNGFIKIYTFNTNKKIELIAEIYNKDISVNNHPVILGDFNGDGKTDILVPKKYTSSWIFFMSKGNSFHVENKSYKDFFFSGNSGGNLRYIERHYVAQDINGDGKTDILLHSLATPVDKSITYTIESIEAFINVGNDINGIPVFRKSSNIYENNKSDLKRFGAPVFFEVNQNKDKNSLDYVYVDKYKLSSYEIKGDHSEDVTLAVIKTSDKTSLSIKYEKLDFNSPSYKPADNLKYPYSNIYFSSNTKVVSRIIENGNLIQDFIYYGGASHVTGLGYLGNQGVAKSNWYSSFDGNLSRIWTVTVHDPVKRGAIMQEYTTTDNPDFTSIHNNFIDKRTYKYDTKILSNKIYVNFPNEIIYENNLTKAHNLQNIQYDSFFNPIKSELYFPKGDFKYDNKLGNIIMGEGDFKTTEYQYIHNPQGIKNNYYIGRTIKKVESAILKDETFSKKEEYTYNNINLVSEIKKTANGNSFIKEGFLYDIYGNIIQKTLSDGITTRIEKFEYDRFGVTLSGYTNPEGMKTDYTYSISTGKLSKETNHLGQLTYFEYDIWGRMTLKMNYLGKKTFYGYHKINDFGDYTVYERIEGGEHKINYFNSENLNIKSKISTLNNKWIVVEKAYDMLGRLQSESEPYFSDEIPSLYSSYEYDIYGRLSKQSLPTGKIKTYTYDALTVTENDGSRKIKTTKDAFGNKIQLEDNGEIIKYTYYPTGQTKKIIYANHTVTTKIDEWGRKISMHDPSISQTPYTYTYNSFDELLTETTPDGKTSYMYSPEGKLLTKTTLGANTDSKVNYEYSGKGLLLKESGSYNGKNFSYTFMYDSFYRLKSLTENSPQAVYVKEYTYDDFGRNVEESITTTFNSSYNSQVITKKQYDDYGNLIAVYNKKNNALLWQLDEVNERKQILKAKFGNGINIQNTIDNIGFITSIAHTSGVVTPLSLNYEFDKKRGTLKSRKNNFYNWNEQFTYDGFDRLLTWSDPDRTNYNEYASDGRITKNSKIGDYLYENSYTRYKKSGIALNTYGVDYYKNRTLQEITYNMFKNPVKIVDKEINTTTFLHSLKFEYNIHHNRTSAISEVNNKLTGNKYYSDDKQVEIITLPSGEVKIVTYILGGPYDSPVIFVTQYKNTQKIEDNYYYLHRDYQGTILAISDASSQIVERRHFDPWGNVVKVTDKNGITQTNNPQFRFIDRGYTGHEHLFNVRLIHMNGRLYDPVLKQFLSPDNYIQDISNSQNYNRYGYVLNNPLMYTDPSGELIIAAPLLGAFWGGVLGGVVVGVGVSVATYAVIGGITGNFTWDGLGKSALYGAVGGAITGGLSGMAASMSNNQFLQGTTFKMLTGIISQTGTNLVFGEPVTLGTIATGVAGGIIGAKTGTWKPIDGGWFANALGELTYSASKGGITGAFGGVVGAVVDGKNAAQGVLQGMKNGAMGGFAQSASLIAAFGATYKPTEDQLRGVKIMSEKTGVPYENVQWRKQGIYQSIMKRNVTWGMTVVTYKGDDPGVLAHEFGHIMQVYGQGWATMQGRGVYDIIFSKGNPYSSEGTNEFDARVSTCKHLTFDCDGIDLNKYK